MSARLILRLRSGAAACALLALGACTAVGPTFKTPEGPKAAAAQGYAMAGDDVSASVRLSPQTRTAGAWWRAFGSPDLDAAVQQALDASPTLAEANATLQKAQAQLDATRGAQQVQVDAKGEGQRERINTAAFGFSGFPSPTINLYSVGGTASYDLDVFGGRRRATERDAATLEAERHRADAAYLTLSGQMVMQAAKIAGLRAQIADAEAVVANDIKIIQMVQQAQAAGGEARSALRVGVAQWAEDQAQIPPLQRDLATARHRMAVLSGKSPAEWRAPDFELSKLAVPDTLPVSLPSDLVRRRPDILAAEADLHSATAAIGVAIANQYPTVRLTATLSQLAIKPGDLFSTDAAAWNLISGVSAPIFNGGTLRAQRAAAEAKARVSLAKYQQVVLQAFVQVSDVLAALGTDDKALEALRQVNAAADAGLQDAQADYKLGGGALLAVVEAQRTVSRARRALAETESRRLSDVVELYAVTATDWRKAS